MAIPRTESISSIYLPHPHKSSLPIEIPGRTHHGSSPSTSTSTRTTSPELIFEMEPFSPLEILSTHYPPGPSTPRTADERECEPLLYPFPMVSASHFNAARRTHPAPQSTASSSSVSSSSRKAPARPIRRTKALSLNPPRQPLDPTHAIKTAPIHKITGFKPVVATAAQAPEPRTPVRKAPREKRLAPLPRRRSSFSAPPWVFPGRGDAPDDEPRSLELDFKQYLLRRIDSQKPLQFQMFQAMSMMSVSVGLVPSQPTALRLTFVRR
ncbi:hypothetical protein B0H10DRAFT_2446620 [Mycena sp. CBHHK59/15]|nr:hypothetical protein B0H10DRAFT_2446620 [Mycena sp. CBHHK59/15]